MAPPVSKDLVAAVRAKHSAEDLLAGNDYIFDQLKVMFEQGFFQPIIYWQIAAIVGAVALGWLLGFLLKRKAIAHFAQEMTEECDPREKQSPDHKEHVFWIQVRRSIGMLFVQTSWAIFSLIFLVISTYLVRVFNLLPPRALPLESVAWLILCAYLVIRFVVYVLNHTVSGGKLNAGTENALGLCIWGIVALQIVGVMPKVTAFLETTKFTLGSTDVSLWSMGMALVTIAVAMIVAKWIGQFIERWLNAISSLQSNVRVVLVRIAKVVLMFCAILVGLASVGIDLTVLGVFGGAVGVGLGFGLQKITSNYVSGFIILLDRSIKIGDMVTVAGVQGIVTDIKTRYTVVRAFDGSVTVIPNESFVTSNFQNTSYLSGPGRTTVEISVDYSSDVDEVVEIMNRIVREQPRILVNPAPYTILSNFGNDGIDLTTYFWVADPERGTATLRSDIRRAFLREFNARGINIPFPQRDLRLLSMPEVVCKFESGVKKD